MALHLSSSVNAVVNKKRNSIKPTLKISPSARRVMTQATPEPSAKKLWGGRFTGKTDPLMEKFNESLPFDKRMWAEDIKGSQAYAKALSKASILTPAEAEAIISGLDKVASEWASNSFVIKQGDEDIHTANERRLTELVGAVGGKLHTGRSRNDQVATDTRLWLRNQLSVLQRCLRDLILVACDRAEAEADVLMPGFTHLQPAMTVRWSHWVLSHASAWQRDDMRLSDLTPRVATLPLGSGALAGNPFGVDRRMISSDLGFEGRVCPNSMDAVSDRDFVAETVFFSSLLMTHLSRFAEDLIIYSSGQFGFVQCSDAYATGSSLMPQKKNPDALELIRGKAGRSLGHLAGVMAVVKGTPTTYNKDFQECWEIMFDCVDTVHDVLRIATGVLSTIQIRPDRMRKGLSADMLATDLAEYLVRKGVPFRETHHLSGAAVRMAEQKGCALSDLTPKDLASIHPLFTDDVVSVWDFNRSAEMRDTEGGASKRSVLEQVEKLRKYLK
uniref:argininosuccinate lyase n=1 Tax=Polytomella parva TaxID=51329 RepID=A0A7S0VKC7_9CHLO|nr:argininosuccinate lyase (ASL) [Polytomella parva]|mmetsp:Transcript_7467/g.14685  ORF Transcript_7467/g.14685 Transcript_7467/m.14685 type:complete len:500 (+) Transcript_7467:126-1625(+)|eukprot:CAMPEP_0175051674 /NCGR_PEP_ID=MMETSP0052_2-20121109/7939_1 /TAXON_ID=51329 ORGANISM="Polytomella parva, Strain SAG 63-3" /NCGR_SAMPLE_ID=MMETSP0052_2 /ASSEMBLY_ACC=CAM_ASM_000194 /LENGTH=499 /DNA_ID=CAMNT_0016316001 /DNA_START=121 /DNA_END=1620 /DNA_ORIENTATION=-